MEGRGVKTYFEKLLRSFPAERRGAPAQAHRGVCPWLRRGDGGCWGAASLGPRAAAGLCDAGCVSRAPRADSLLRIPVALAGLGSFESWPASGSPALDAGPHEAARGSCRGR